MSISYNKHLKFKRLIKRKALFSNEVKKGLFLAFTEAKKIKFMLRQSCFFMV